MIAARRPIHLPERVGPPTVLLAIGAARYTFHRVQPAVTIPVARVAA